MTIRTRFAPSPTGFLHVGSARTALYSWLYAKRMGGQFILRIEDTDLERSTPEAVDAILEAMDWLGLDYDEGPFYQTKHFDRYREAADQLLKTDCAYYCYCSKERLEKLREEQTQNKEKPRYDGHCRDLKLPARNEPHVIRFRNPEHGSVVIDDCVRGRVVIQNSELDDLIIVRSDGTPTYNFTVLVIDTDEIARQLLAPDQPLLKEVVQHFGEKILNKDGVLNRAKLRSLVFESTADRHWLEALLHPRIKEKVLQYSDHQKSKTEKKAPYLIVDIPLLIEAHFEDIVDHILVIDCPLNLQIERIQKRDATPVNVIQQIIQTQVDRKTRLQKADDVIENTGTLEVLKNKVFALHRYYQSKGSSLDTDKTNKTVK